MTMAAKTQPDCQDTKGKWLQRCWKDGKYIWTISGVLWNNVKERCTSGSATQSREPTYIGAVNRFEGFQEFVSWHQLQVSYGLGYDLDSDILKGWEHSADSQPSFLFDLIIKSNYKL